LIAVDANILIYAHREDSPFHLAALARMVELAEGSAAWAIPWPCVHEFLAIVTNPRIYVPPSSLAVALDAIEAWLQSPTLVLLAESAVHWATLRPLLLKGRIAGGRVHDARIAALCLQHGVREFWSADRDFSRFPELITINPVVRASD
jgi:hypothetical protein